MSVARQRLPLRLHPDCAESGFAVEIEITRRSTALALHYFVRADPGSLLLPEIRTPMRADGLWNHTCFEAFVGSQGQSGYLELNFSPSREWAAYTFQGYRDGMVVAHGIANPAIRVQSDHSGFALSAAPEISGIAVLRDAEDWQVGVSAVIEDRNGNKSYWALAHPPGKPDFHHPECFVLALHPHQTA